MPTPIDKKESIERLRALPQVRRWREGNYEPGEWFTSKPSEEGGIWGTWGHRFAPNRRGVSLVELNRADRHPIPSQGLGLLADREGGSGSRARRATTIRSTRNIRSGPTMWRAFTKRRYRGNGAPLATSRGTSWSRCPRIRSARCASLSASCIRSSSCPATPCPITWRGSIRGFRSAAVPVLAMRR